MGVEQGERERGVVSCRTDIERLRLRTHCHLRKATTDTRTHTQTEHTHTYILAHSWHRHVPGHMHVNPCTRPNPTPATPRLASSSPSPSPPLAHNSSINFHASWHCVWFWVCARVLAQVLVLEPGPENPVRARLIAEMLPFWRGTVGPHRAKTLLKLMRINEMRINFLNLCEWIPINICSWEKFMFFERVIEIYSTMSWIFCKFHWKTIVLYFCILIKKQISTYYDDFKCRENSNSQTQYYLICKICKILKML